MPISPFRCVRAVSLTLGILLLAGLGSAALAQAPVMDSSKEKTRDTAAATASTKYSTDWMEARLAKMHRKLHITPAQEAAWNDYAVAMREAAKAMEPLYMKYYTQQAGLTAVDNMKLYMDMSAEHAKAQAKLIPPFEKLYNMMSIDQRSTADELFADQEQPKPRKGKRK